MGMERLVLLLKELEQVGDIRRNCDVYIAAMGDAASIKAPVIAESLREQVPGIRIIVHAGGGNFKKQLKRADKTDALIALILGESELENNQVTVKYLREHQEQQTLELAQAAELLKALL
jgi:histidyl-tRNA synthetase